MLPSKYKPYIEDWMFPVSILVFWLVVIIICCVFNQ
jgi:hypothetical protein